MTAKYRFILIRHESQPTIHTISLPSLTSFNTPSSFTSQTGRDAPINIVVNAIDGEGAARAVAQTLNSQAARSVTALRDK